MELVLVSQLSSLVAERLELVDAVLLKSQCKEGPLPQVVLGVGLALPQTVLQVLVKNRAQARVSAVLTVFVGLNLRILILASSSSFFASFTILST